jgi:hypothetical protein
MSRLHREEFRKDGWPGNSTRGCRSPRTAVPGPLRSAALQARQSPQRRRAGTTKAGRSDIFSARCSWPFRALLALVNSVRLRHSRRRAAQNTNGCRVTGRRHRAHHRAGVAPWVRPWTTTGVSDMPTNFATQRTYRGANILNLWMAQTARGYDTAEWMTFKQTIDHGACVRNPGTTAASRVYRDLGSSAARGQ